jgi:hypothetical protein
VGKSLGIESELSFFRGVTEQKLHALPDGTIRSRRPSKEVLVPDDKSNRGDRDNESRQTSGRDGNRGETSSNDRERNEGRFESDDSESGSSSSRGESSGSSSEGSSKKK